MPQPDGTGKIFQRSTHTHTTITLRRLVRRAQFKHHLLFCTQVQALKMAPLAEIPYMQAVTVLAAEQQLRIHAVLHHVRCSPLARDGNVMSQVPGEIVAKVLGTAIDLPSTERLEVVVIQGEDSAGTIAARRAQSAQVDAVGPAVNRVRAAVTSPLLHVLWLDHFYNLRLLGIVLGVDHMDARRAKTGNNQIPTFDVRMRSIGTQRGTARVPAEMMKFVSPIRHIYAAHDLPVLVRPAVYISNEQSIRMIATVGIQSGHIRQPLYGRLHGKLGRGIERWISLPGHWMTSSLRYRPPGPPVRSRRLSLH